MSSADFFAHRTAIVESSQIGEGTRIWAFCNVQAKAVIGRDCNICDHCFIENNVVLGDRVTIKNGVAVWDGVVLESDVFVGPNAVFTNDVFPRSKVYHDQPAATLVGRGATIGANAVIIAGHTIGRYAFIGAGAVVTKDVPAYTMWLGNPARQVGFVCKCAERLNVGEAPADHSVLECTCGLTYRLSGGKLTPLDDGGEGGA